MTRKICTKCGKMYDSPVACPYCGAVGLTDEQAPVPIGVEDNRHNRSVVKKMELKKQEFDNANGYGPTVCILIGLFGFFVVFPLLFLVVGICWAVVNSNARNRIKLEMADLVEQFQ